MKIILCLLILVLPLSANAMSANEMIAALQASVASNGNADVPIVLQVTAAKSAGQAISSVSSITFVGPIVHEGPGSPSVETPAVVNILLP